MVDSLYGEKNTSRLLREKCRIVKLPVLHLSDTKGRFHLYSDMSEFATGSTSYQIQNGKPKLIACASKRLPTTRSSKKLFNDRIRDVCFSYYLFNRVDFDAIEDHLALTHIIKGKAEPCIIRRKRILELLSSYSFTLYYIKGKDMIPSNFLSRQKHDKSNPHEIISILFNMQGFIHNRYYKIGEENSGKHLVQTQSQAKSSAIKLPGVHSIGKRLNQNMQPARQVVRSIVVAKAEKNILNKSKIRSRKSRIRA